MDPSETTYIMDSTHEHSSDTSSSYFDVLLTVHLSIILVINQLNAQILVL